MTYLSNHNTDSMDTTPVSATPLGTKRSNENINFSTPENRIKRQASLNDNQSITADNINKKMSSLFPGNENFSRSSVRILFTYSLRFTLVPLTLLEIIHSRVPLLDYSLHILSK